MRRYYIILPATGRFGMTLVSGQFVGDSVARTFDYRGYKLRVQEVDGDAWIYVVDLCRILGLAPDRPRSYDSILRGISHADRRVVLDRRPGLTGKRYICVNEVGYHAIFARARHRKAVPGINDFHDWMIGFVLPTVRGVSSCFLPPEPRVEETNAEAF